tara:strand:- start:257 stop:934 length:678 start_codon:yes stop_codon:yes gene_type:complete
MHLFEFSNKLPGYKAFLYSSNDKVDTNNIELRRSILNQVIGSVSSISFPIQVHSNRVVWSGLNVIHKSYDGILSTYGDKNFISIQVADCVPIYIIDKDSGSYGLVHSGWRGSLDSIVLNAVKELEYKGSSLNNLYFFLGPHIKQDEYEVGSDVALKFSSDCIKIIDKKYYLSIKGKIINDLKSYGIDEENITVSNISTYKDRRCQSFRRDRHRAGTMYAFLGIYE